MRSSMDASGRTLQQNWAAYLKDCLAQLETLTEVDQITELQTLLWQPSASRRVPSAVALHGISSLKIFEEFSGQTHWLSIQEGDVPEPWSPFFKRSMHAVAVNHAWPANIFWSKVTNEAVAAVLSVDTAHEETQVGFIVSKPLCIFQNAREQKDTVADVGSFVEIFHSAEVFAGFDGRNALSLRCRCLVALSSLSTGQRTSRCLSASVGFLQASSTPLPS